MPDAFDELENTKSNVGGSGDYAPWWNTEEFGVEEGDVLVGVCVEKHAYTDPGGEDHPVATIRSIGGDRSHLGEGVEVSTPTRKGIEPFADKLEIGDLALIEYTGQVQANSGRDMHTYEASSLTQEEWQDTDQADQVQEVWDGSDHNGSTSSDGGVVQKEKQESGDVPKAAVDFAEDTLQINDGEVSVDELDEYLNEVRDYNVDVAAVVDAGGFELDDDTVSL